MAPTSIIVIGASVGGVEALRFLVAALPASLSVPVLVVLHVGAHRSELPFLLNAPGSIVAKHAEGGELVRPGRIYVAPPDHHMTLDGQRLQLSRGPKENWARPAIDPLFRSAAKVYGPKAIGVILTGGLNDGTLGLFELKVCGGIAVAQKDAAYPDMPRSAARHVQLDYFLPLAEIPKLLVDLVSREGRKELVMPDTALQPSAQHDAKIIGAERFDRPVAITCPDCGGALRKSNVGSIVKYGCHIGHTYTAEVAATAQFDDMERILRSAVRSLNERAEFCREMSELEASTTHDGSSGWHAASEQALQRAYKLRDLLEEDWIIPDASDRPALTKER